MQKTTIKWRIFKYNFIIIILLIVLVTVIFNIAGRAYFEREIVSQLEKIAIEGENAIFEQAPKLFDESRSNVQSDSSKSNITTSSTEPGSLNSTAPAPGKPSGDIPPNTKKGGTRADSQSPELNKGTPSGPSESPNSANEKKYPFKPDPSFDFFMRVNRSLRQPLSILNAEYLLFDRNKNQILNFEAGIYSPSVQIEYIKNILTSDKPQNKSFKFEAEGVQYTAIIKQVTDKNPVNLGWIVIYSSLEKVNQMQVVINLILTIILTISAAVIIIISSVVSKKLSSPFSAINEHIKVMTEHKFGSKISLEADDEFQELVSNINLMSEKLETYDKAQKTFLQNVSHEFRTPLMSIQSYAEGITYGVVDSQTAVEVIIDEVKRLTMLVEDLLYLSRLDAIEENYNYSVLELNDFIKTCIERMNAIGIKKGIEMIYNDMPSEITIYADEEKLFRAFNNIIGNCIRYASSKVIIEGNLIEAGKVQIKIKDDGPGFDERDLPNLFERFYKGKNGNFGLGLAISKSVIVKHRGDISAQNHGNGALFTILLPVKEA